MSFKFVFLPEALREYVVHLSEEEIISMRT